MSTTGAPWPQAITAGDLDSAKQLLREAKGGGESPHFFVVAAELAAARGNARGARERLCQALVAAPELTPYLVPGLVLAEAQLAADAVFASNTSTLPITGLARASVRPDRFIGLHFFSPVDKMPLVEIIVGKATSDETLARGFDFVLQIGKTPIVVNDSRGFYTSRVFGTYVMEGIAMLAEGVHPRSIEVAGLQAGMPMPPLALQDEVSLSLGLHVADQTKKDLAAEGKAYVEHPGMAVVRQLCALGRIGKKSGQGFYDYAEGDKSLWPGLTRLYPTAAQQPPQRELIARLMFAQANEAARCFQEGVLRSVADANVGSIFGWGFAPFHGGALQFIDALGASAFVARSRELAAKYGPRFEPAQVVVEQALRGGHFSDAAAKAGT